MKHFAVITFATSLVLSIGIACKDTATAPPSATAGTITVSASGIAGKSGKVLTVMVYDFDWLPGSPNTIVGASAASISSDPFSFSAVVDSVDGLNMQTGTAKTFHPATYSVVFYISAAGSPPELFHEVRVAVNGNMTVSAPAWGSW